MEHLPESAALCLDLYHVGHAGLSMEETIEKYRGKICMVHFKDFRKDGEEECLVPVGRGYGLVRRSARLHGDKGALWIRGAGTVGPGSFRLPEGKF